MHLLTPAQLFIVLWLLAAAAPAATVLMNGSLVPLAAARARCQGAAAVELRQRESQARDRCSVALAGSCEKCAARASGVRVSQDASVLHTAVQRHRPRVA